MSGDPVLDPLAYGILEHNFCGVAFHLVGLSVDDIRPDGMVSDLCLSDDWIGRSYLGSSVASLALLTPMTAASAMSGCDRSTLSSSAGGT